MKSKPTIALLVLLLLACMITIFLLSAQPVTDTLRLSGNVSNKIAGLFHQTSLAADTFAHWIGIKDFDRFIRKCAHVLLYFTLALLLTLLLKSCKRRSRFCIMMVMLFGILFAGGDELHQHFVQGRTACLTDILIDSCGSALGLAMGLLLAAAKNKLFIKHGQCKRNK